MRFEISRMELIKNSFGKNDLIIRQIKVMDNNGKYIKFARLNDALIDALKNAGTVGIKGE